MAAWRLTRPPLHPNLNFQALTHREKVKSLYKRSLEQIQDHYGKFGLLEVRYRQVKLRAEFDKYMNLNDMREIKKLMDKQEASLKTMYGEEKAKYPFSEGGIAFQRDFSIEDIALDHWHPYQKAQYPEFFAKREQLKEEYLKLYEETYGDLKKNLGVHEHATFGSKPYDWVEGEDNDPKKLEDENRERKRLDHLKALED